MPRRRWIKLWTQETLYGTTSDELTLEQQAIWFKLQALAGDSPVPGVLCLAPTVPYPLQAMADVFKCPLNLLEETLLVCSSPDVDKVCQNGDGCWMIKNFWKYQPQIDRTEYQRQYMQRYRADSKPNKSKPNTRNTKGGKALPPDQTRRI